jgi:hypothetical protein
MVGIRNNQKVVFFWFVLDDGSAEEALFMGFWYILSETHSGRVWLIFFQVCGGALLAVTSPAAIFINTSGKVEAR